MGIQTIRVDFPGHHVPLDLDVDNATFSLRDWRNGAFHQAAKFNDAEVLPLHLLFFLLSQQTILTVNGKELNYQQLKTHYLKDRDLLNLGQGNARLSLILRRIFQQHGWDLNSEDPLDSRSLLTALVQGDPISVSLLEKHQ